MREEWISTKAAEAIAKKEFPEAEKGKVWVLPGFCYSAKAVGYRIKIYYELTVYDLFLDAVNGKILQKRASYI